MIDGGSSKQRPDDGANVGASAVKWGAIVIIVISILYFLARYIVPLLY